MRDPKDMIGQNLQPEQIVQHLNAVLADPAFASSRRCQDFLRYVVSEAVEGRSEDINERNIAHIVFGKSQRFEPSEDSLVRVKAREVRRRLAQYYTSHPESGLRIDLSHGGYTPSFILEEPSPQPAPLEAVPPAVAAPRPSRRKVLWYLGASVVSAAAAVSVPIWRKAHAAHSQPPTNLQLLWQPVAETKSPLLLFAPVLQTKSPHGVLADRVGIGVTAAISQAVHFLDAHSLPYTLRFGSGLTFAQLREQPSLILGGFTSSWSLWAIHGLRYNLVAGKQWADSYILDTQTQQKWQAENLKPDGYATADYAIVARLFDAVSEQILFVAAGITTFGTEGAASVLFDSNALAQLLQGAPGNWPSKNFEAIVKVSIFGTTPSAPEIVAKHFW
jgi:hypothetical protein